MSRQPRERVFTLSLVEAWLDANDEKDDDDNERRETLTGLLVKVMSAPLYRERHVKLAPLVVVVVFLIVRVEPRFNGRQGEGAFPHAASLCPGFV